MHYLCLRKTFQAKVNMPPIKNRRRDSDEIYRRLTHRRKQCVVGDIEVSSSALPPIYEKRHTTEELIKNAILKNEFLGELDEPRLAEVISQMYPKNVKANTRLIHEGETGSHLYVSEEGTFEIYKGNTYNGTFGPGVAFGELALLYDTKRLCSIDAHTNGKVWVLDRKVFKAIRQKTEEEGVQYNLQLLRRISLMSSLPEEALLKISDLITVEFYSANSYIIREGDPGNKFYIVNGGNVLITKNRSNGTEEELTILQKGDYFGEKALYDENASQRQANAIALPPGVECYTIDRISFLDYLGGMESIRNRDWQIYSRRILADNWDEKFQNLRLADMEPEGTIGTGGYGRVELITITSMPNESFARKKVKKYMITQGKFQKLIYNEKENWKLCNSLFVCKLHRTFKDNKYLYFLMDVGLGGDLRSALHRVGRYDNASAKFIAGCVVEGLSHLHSLGIIYRDLKPENVVIDRHGYAKLTDLGSSKKIGLYKTKTFIGTPEYLAPEIILSKAYNGAADYWALGVVIYELLVGRTPFHNTDDLEMYKRILNGFNEACTPPFVKAAAKNIIRSLLEDDPVKRLGHLRSGVTDIQNHRWFSRFNWQDLRSQTLASPIVPVVKNHLDLRNFERYLPDRNAAPSDFSDWDHNF